MIDNNGKAQGMPINVIVVAALALIVLVILAVMFAGRTKIFAETLQSCAAKQGQCEEGPLCKNNKVLITNTNCPETEQDKKEPKKTICCVQVLNQEK